MTMQERGAVERETVEDWIESIDADLTGADLIWMREHDAEDARRAAVLRQCVEDLRAIRTEKEALPDDYEGWNISLPLQVRAWYTLAAAEQVLKGGGDGA